MVKDKRESVTKLENNENEHKAKRYSVTKILQLNEAQDETKKERKNSSDIKQKERKYSVTRVIQINENNEQKNLADGGK
jgi:hypothetical protein